MIENIPLPRLLDDAGNTVRSIQATRVSINLNITPLSDASLTLPQEESLPARAYVELFTCLGSAGIFRVRSPQDSYGTVSTNADLEHAIVEVGDFLVLAEIKQMMPASTAMSTVFSHYRGTRWQLGSVAALGNDQIAVDVKYDRVLEAMLSILNQKPDCMLTFDFSTTPWTVSVVARDTTVTAEGRLARNINYAKVVYDDTELCTRAYYEIPATENAGTSYFQTFDPAQSYGAGVYVVYSGDGKLYRLPDGHTSGTAWENTTKEALTDSPTTSWTHKDADTVGTYGVIEREVTTGSDYALDEINASVDTYLNAHKNPRISVEISAEELSHITGEPLDSFAVGKLCRLALPDYGVIIEKTITSLYWADVYGLPDSITVNLADEEDTALTFLHDVDASGGSGGGGGGQKDEEEKWKEYRTRFEQNDYHFRLVAERVSQTERVLQQAGLYINREGVLIYAEDNENNLGSKLTVTAEAIRAEVSRATSAEAGLSGRIDIEADRIGLVVTGTGANAHINPAGIVLAINQQTGQSTVRISADKISVNGDVTVGNFLSVTEAGAEVDCDWISAGNVETQSLTVGESGFMAYSDATFLQNVSVTGGKLKIDNTAVSWQTATIVTGVGVTLPTVTRSQSHYFSYDDSGHGGTTGTAQGRIITGYTAGSVSPVTETIHYLGRANA